MTELSNAPEENEQLTEILNQLKILSQRVSDIEDKLILVTDIKLYSQLQQFLAAGDLKHADRETTNVILEAVAKDRETLTPEDMLSFPCSVLGVVDALWRRYSNERFGFGRQLKLYQSVGGSLDTLRTQDREVLRKFAEKVGWFKEGVSQGDHYDQWDFSLSCKEGCFPAIWWKSPYGLKMVTFCFIRLFDCES